MHALLEDMRGRGLSLAYLHTATSNRTRFGRDFCCPITTVSPDAVSEWLRNRGVSAKTQRGIRGLLVRLFNYAASKRLISRDHAAEIAEIATPKWWSPTA